jgi:hypothetical protein
MIAMTLLVAGVIYATTVYRSTYHDFAHHLSSIRSALFREEVLVSSYTLARDLNWYEQDLTPRMPNDLLERLGRNRIDFENYHTRLYDIVSTVDVQHLNHLDSYPSLTVTIPVGNSFYTETKGLWELGLEYITKMEVILEDDDVQSTNRIDSFAYIATNGPNVMATAMERATSYLMDLSEFMRNMHGHMFYLCFTLVFILVATFLIGSVYINRFYAQQQKIFSMFLKISRADIVRIQMMVRKKIEKVKKDGNEMNDSDIIIHEEGDEELEESLGLGSRIGKKRSEINLAMTRKKQEQNKGRKKTISATFSSSFRQLVANSFLSKSHTWILLLFFKLAVMFSIPIIFVITQYYIASIRFDSLSYFSRELDVCGRRSMTVHGIHYELQNFIQADLHSSDANASLNSLNLLDEELVDLEHAFIFGSRQYGMKGVNERADSVQNDILYGDACRLMDTRELRQNCTAFDSGLFLNGLHRALTEYRYLVSRVVHMRQVQNMTINGTLLSEEYGLLEEMQRVYLSEMLISSVDLVDKQGRNECYNVTIWLNTVNIIGGLSLLVIYFIYRANVSRLENIMRHNRSLPLIIPVEIAPKLKALKDYIRHAQSNDYMK